MHTLETDRLVLRRLSTGDDAFILELLNEPAWLQHIGDRGVRTLADARRYLTEGPIAMQARHGFSLLAVERKVDATPLGICGLLKRDTLEDIDLGFAFLERQWGQGYASESATATMNHARDALHLQRVVALTSPDNDRSIGLLTKLGFAFERMIRPAAAASEAKLFAWSAPQA